MKLSRSSSRRTRSRYNIKIKTVRGKDENVARVVEEMKKARVKLLRGDEWQIERKLVLKEENIYIPVTAQTPSYVYFYFSIKNLLVFWSFIIDLFLSKALWLFGFILRLLYKVSYFLLSNINSF